jgi:hypothetical protein
MYLVCISVLFDDALLFGSFYKLLFSSVLLVDLVFDCDSYDVFPLVLTVEFWDSTVVLFLGEGKSLLSLVSVNDKCLLSDDLLSKKTPRPLLANTCVEYPATVNTNITKTRILIMMYLIHQLLNSSIFLVICYGIRKRDFTSLPRQSRNN